MAKANCHSPRQATLDHLFAVTRHWLCVANRLGCFLLF